jgi:sigma-B regulation protein RsbU (phosphoserine phosphatase)
MARRLVRSVLREAGLDNLADDALLLVSELCENAVLHAGTGFELHMTLTAGELTVSVTDQGSTAMELRRAEPTVRRSTHNRGLLLVDALATAWGSRHDERGHQVWFTLRADDRPAPPPPAPPPPPLDRGWPDVASCRWLLHIPAQSTAVLPLAALVTELVRRLCDVLGADGGSVWVDDGDGERELTAYGRPPAEAASSVVALPLGAPRKGRLEVTGPADTPPPVHVLELAAQRIALAIDTDRVHSADHERWTWMTHLAEASDLLGQSLDLDLTAAIVPQIIVPRLGYWCAVHLLDERGELQLRAVTHVDETQLPRLRADLTGLYLTDLHATVRRLLESGADATGIGPPLRGIAVPLRVGRVPLGILSVGRRADHAHNPDEAMMITELARRAAQAIDNARRNAAHIATSRALQQALLPRALPTAAGVRFAAAYLPAATGADVGGDFYDVLTLGEGQWLAAVGDVCGTGARAAARTGLVRDVLRVLVRDGQPLVRAVELLNEMMLEAEDPGQYATVALALISRHPAADAGLAVELVLAGHEQPVLVRADGAVALVGQHGNPVGLVDNFFVCPTRHVLNPGDSLVFYTDGVVERRRGTEQFGHNRLVQTIASAAGNSVSADGLITAVHRAVDQFSPEPHRDDIVIMVALVPDDDPGPADDPDPA